MSRTCLSLLLVVCFGLATLDATADSNTLSNLFAAEWDYTMEQNPTWASSLGDRRWNDVWPDLRLEAIEAGHAHDLDVLKRLAAVDRTSLSVGDQLNYDLFKKKIEEGVEGHPFGWYLIVLNQRGGIQTENELADSLRFETVKDFKDWNMRLKRFSIYMDQTIALMREGIRRKVLLPKITAQRIPAQIDKQIVAKAEDSPFFKPLTAMPKDFSEADRKKLVLEANVNIEQSVLPAYRKFKEFFEKEYLPACYDNVGAWQLPRGDEMYAYFARSFTTTELSPEQIHQIGLGEVKRIRGEMEKIKSKVGFNGTLPEFFEHLRTDKQFFFKDGKELLAASQALAKRIDPLMVKVFKTLPRIPYGVEPIPDAIAPDTTTAYYRPPAADGSRAGSYFVNLYLPETRPKWEMTALTLHEAVPGHHHQIALAMELGELPKFRRYTGYTAFVEGWGLYSEFLGEEMGMYEDPYDKFGQLTYEMWRAVRLVVDTGMHAKKWTRQQAIDFFKDNAPKAENDIVNEVDRYISWPGQALAYKIGELKLKELRTLASKELDAKFDVKEFHDVVLLGGAVPLDVLEQRVKAWIEARRL